MNRRERGTEYENLAAEYLKEKGYDILARNFRCHMGEIDLIAAQRNKDGRATLVFVEVKYRRGPETGYPEEAVTRKKQRTISRVADFYRTRWQIPLDHPCRFDVIAIEGACIRHYENAFPYAFRS